MTASVPEQVGESRLTALALIEAELDSPVLTHFGDIDLRRTAEAILDSLWTTYGLDVGFAIRSALGADRWDGCCFLNGLPCSQTAAECPCECHDETVQSDSRADS